MTEQERRLDILKQIDAWDAKRCKKCETQHNHSHMCMCKAAKEIRKLGVQYEAPSRERRQKRIAELKKQFEKPTAEVYDALKCLDVDDKTLRKLLKLSDRQWQHWKYSVGRMTRMPAGWEIENDAELSAQEQERLARQVEYRKWKEVALKNGISAKSYSQRINQFNMTMQAAATTPKPPHGKRYSKVSAADQLCEAMNEVKRLEELK